MQAGKIICPKANSSLPVESGYIGPVDRVITLTQQVLETKLSPGLYKARPAPEAQLWGSSSDRSLIQVTD